VKSLYVFVDSERPDQYLNAVVHCVRDRDIRNVVFLHIKKLTSVEQTKDGAGLSARVMAAVQGQLEDLAERGEYLLREGSRSGERVRLTAEYGEARAQQIQDFYKYVRGLPITWSNAELAYDSLGAKLEEIARRNSDSYVDITAIKKRYLGDIVAAGLVVGLNGLWAFDLGLSVQDFARPWRMLIHELSAPHSPQFNYVNILDTQTYRACIRRLFVRSPVRKWVAGITVAFLVVGGLLYYGLGESSPVIRVMLAISGFSGLAQLVMIFVPPRSSQ
jgi:hypothetical protein